MQCNCILLREAYEYFKQMISETTPKIEKIVKKKSIIQILKQPLPNLEEIE